MSYYGNRVSKICNGCAHKTGICGVVLMRVDVDKLELCPCKNCLIKMMCQRICSERAQYYGRVSSGEADEFNKHYRSNISIRRLK